MDGRTEDGRRRRDGRGDGRTDRGRRRRRRSTTGRTDRGRTMTTRRKDGQRTTATTGRPSEGCFSDVRGPTIPKTSPQMLRTQIVHTSGKCSIFWFGGRFFRFWGSKKIFNLCFNIEFNTPNPNPILKITISFTKTPTNPKHFRKQKTKHFEK